MQAFDEVTLGIADKATDRYDVFEQQFGQELSKSRWTIANNVVTDLIDCY